MYAQSLLMTWVRGMGLLPITAASFALGCKGLMNAGFGARFLPEDFLVALSLPSSGRRAASPTSSLTSSYRQSFFALVVAIASLPE